MIEEIKATYQETLARKREEFEASLQRGEVADPITLFGVVITWQAIAASAAISVAVAAASYALGQAFAPKPPRQQIGKMQGTLQMMNSEQGLMIPEIYGAGPTATLVTGSNPTWQNLTNTTGGANGSITKTSGTANFYDAGASHNVAVTSGDAFIEVIASSGSASAGFSTTASPTGDADFLFGVQWHSSGSVQVKISGLNHDIGHWIANDRFRVEIRKGRFRLFKNSAELSGFSEPVPVVTYPLYLGVAMFTTGAGTSNTKVQIGSIGDPPNAGRGGIKVPAIIVWTSGIRKNVSTTTTRISGGMSGLGARSQTTDNISYDLDVRATYCRGLAVLLREYANAEILIDRFDQFAGVSGIVDTTVGADATYDVTTPPDALMEYSMATSRADGNLVMGPPGEPGDPGTGTGTTTGGGGSPFAVYSGSSVQDPDPTEEAYINGKYGTGSVTAYRHSAGVVHTRFDLSRWGGMVPNLTAVWQHATLKTLDAIYSSLCERVGVLAANDDYDFSGIVIPSRGMLLAGRLFQPAEVIGSPEIELTYNYFATEVEGQIVGFTEGDEPSITIDDTEVGWLDGESDVPDIIPEVESVLASEILLPREVIVKFIDPDKEWDMNTQSAKRQVTEGSGTETLEVQLALLTEEARAVAQRKLYRDYVAGTVHKFTLPWTYLYLYPGYKIIINRAEGFTHTLRLTSISGGIGVMECEGVAIEPEVFNQPATGSTGIPSTPPQVIPAMTVLSLLDTPALRDEDEGKIGQYAVGTPRTGFNQAWQGYVLVMNKKNEWHFKTESKIAGTIGTIVSVTSLSTDTTTIDHVGEIVVDLYGTTKTLSSVTEADIANNLGLFGNMLGNFADVAQVAGFPNRWAITTLLNGQKETDEFISTVAVGDRFVLIDEAVKFVPMDLEDLNIEMEYKAVTVGQSLDDAATILATWIGAVMRDHKVTNLTGVRDGSSNWHFSAIGHPRELPAFYNLRIRRVSDDVVMRDIPIATGGTQAAVFGDTFGDIAVTNNSLLAGALLPFTAVASTDVITATGHPFSNDSKVRVTNTGGALPAPLLIDTDYFVVNKSGDTLKLAATLGGSAINLTTNGTGTSFIRTAPFTVTGARTTQEITGPGAFLEFVLPGLNTLAGGSLNLALFHSADTGWTDTSAWTVGVYTLRMVVTDVVTGEWAISFWDVGGEDAGEELLANSSIGLGPMKIRLTFSGSELRIYKDWANSSTEPLVISKVPPADHFPMKAAFYLATGAVNSDAARIQQAVIGGMSEPSTIYSKAQQDHDDPITDMATIDAEMWEVSIVDGRKVRKEFP